MSKRNQGHGEGDVPKEADDDDQQKARPSDHHEETLQLLEEVFWEDIEDDLFDVAELMWWALAATAEAADSWSDHAERLGHVDGFPRSEEEIGALDPEARLAFVGQLVHGLSLRLGVPDADYIGEQIVPFLARLMTTFTGLPPTAVPDWLE
jgi:hypothetical protein